MSRLARAAAYFGDTPVERRGRARLVVAGVLGLVALGLAGCNWRDGKPTDVASCVARCRGCGGAFDEMRVGAWSGDARQCLCRFDMPFVDDPDSAEERRCIEKCTAAGLNRSRWTPTTAECLCFPGAQPDGGTGR